jgi:hypothetical protein
MAHAARAHIESLLRTRKLDVTLTSAAPWREPVFDAAATGMTAVDEALGGGLRRGHLSEVVGARSSGRTTLVCRALAETAARGEMAALVDTHDRFDSVSAETSGVDLSRLLWIRERGDAARALKAMNLVLQAGSFGLVVFDLADVPARDLRSFPATTWMRLARVIEGSQTVALLVASERIARSPGGVTIALGPPSPHWAGAGDRARLLREMGIEARVVGAKI